MGTFVDQGSAGPTSRSRTSLDQTKSVELTAFACAFPPLIWATWATKYRWPQFGMFTLADLPVASRLPGQDSNYNLSVTEPNSLANSTILRASSVLLPK